MFLTAVSGGRTPLRGSAATDALVSSMNQLSAALARAGLRDPAPGPTLGPTSPAAPSKKTLQTQYVELQEQFGKWQQQLIDNQAVLTAKRGDRYGSTETLHTGASPAPAPPRLSGASSLGNLSRVGLSTAKADAARVTPVAPLGAARTYRAGASGGRQSTPPASPGVSRGYQGRGEPTPPPSPFSPPAVHQLVSAKATLRQKSAGSVDDVGSSVRFNAVRPSGATARPAATRATQVAGPVSIQASGPAARPVSMQAATQAARPVSMQATRPVSTQVAGPAATQASRPMSMQAASQPASQAAGGGRRAASRDPRRFEPVLDPREQLMIAIRNASGRSTLRKVGEQ